MYGYTKAVLYLILFDFNLLTLYVFADKSYVYLYCFILCVFTEINNNAFCSNDLLNRNKDNIVLFENPKRPNKDTKTQSVCFVTLIYVYIEMVIENVICNDT